MTPPSLARVLPEKTWQPETILRLITGLLLCLGVGGLIAPLILSKEAAATSEGRFASLVLFSCVMHGGGLLLISRFLAWNKLTWAEAFGWRLTPPAKAIGYGVMVTIFFLPAAWMLGQVSALVMQLINLNPVQQQAVQMLQKTELPLQQAYFGVLAVVLAPVLEEMFFRGIMYPALKQSGHPRAAVWGTSLFFAFSHANVMTFVPLTVLALMLIWLYEKTGNLLSCIVAHATFNLVNFLLLINQQAVEEWLKRWQTGAT